MKRVSIQGIRGSYSEEAAGILVDGGIRIIECPTFEDTFSVVSRGDADFAVVPLRNKIVGEIHSATSALRKSGLRTAESVELQVRHVLAGIAGSKFELITHVFSHPEAIRQCGEFFLNHPGLQAMDSIDTASALRDVIEWNDLEKAAIASERAVAMYGGKILRRNIADDDKNLTAFYLVKK